MLQNGHCFGSKSAANSVSSTSSLRYPIVSRQPQSRHFSSQQSIVRSSDSKWLYLQTSGHSARGSFCGHLPPGGILGFTGFPLVLIGEGVNTLKVLLANYRRKRQRQSKREKAHPKINAEDIVVASVALIFRFGAHPFLYTNGYGYWRLLEFEGIWPCREDR